MYQCYYVTGYQDVHNNGGWFSNALHAYLGKNMVSVEMRPIQIFPAIHSPWKLKLQHSSMNVVVEFFLI